MSTRTGLFLVIGANDKIKIELNKIIMSVNDKDKGSVRGFKISGDTFTEFQSAGLGDDEWRIF